MPIGALVAEVVASAAPAARARGLGLTMVEPAPATSIVGDAFLLQRAVANLIDNALDFSPPGGTVTVEVTRYAEKTQL